jgi:hypothetical protein
VLFEHAAQGWSGKQFGGVDTRSAPPFLFVAPVSRVSVSRMPISLVS